MGTKSNLLASTSVVLILSIALALSHAENYGDEKKPEVREEIKCGPNSHYVAEVNNCPPTCESHFFGAVPCYSKKKSHPGCDCDQGFVMDNGNCVRPEECQCLDKICVDRVDSNTCEKWREDGRCEKFASEMGRVCRKTCGLCQISCRDVMKTEQCKIEKEKGRCDDHFVKQMCQGTCNPRSCECPECKETKSECSPLTHNREIKKICYIHADGVCKPVTTNCRFEPCGTVCVDKSERKPSLCNYCTKTRLVSIALQYREKGGQCRCIRVKSTKTEPCGCPEKRWKKSCCEGEDEKVEYEYSYGPDESCGKCEIKKVRNVIEKIKCRGKFSKTSDCDASGKKYIHDYEETAKNCKCEKTLINTRMIICSCPKSVRSGPICVDNQRQYRTVNFHLKDNACVRKISKRNENVPCDTQKQVTYQCKEDCKRIKTETYNELENCQCIPRKQVSESGVCCCPKPHKTTTPCVDMFIHQEKISYDLINNACIRKVEKCKKRCACEADKEVKYCDEATGHKVEGYVRHVLVNGECEKKEEIKRIPVKCRAVEVSAVTGCTLRDASSMKLFRKIKVVTYERVACGCQQKVEFHKEVCGCQAAEHCEEVKKCPPSCSDPATCTDDCVSVKVYYKFMFVKLDESGCKCDKQILKRVTTRCCCPKNPKTTKQCVNDNQIETAYRETQLQNNKCITLKSKNVETVKCPTGFVGRERGPLRRDGTYDIIYKYGYIKDCKCLTKTRTKPCRYKCGPPHAKTTCDTATGQLVRVVDLEVLSGCKCESRRHTRRVTLACAEGVVEVDKDCSQETGIETTVFEKTFRQGCKCMVTRHAKTKMCKCPESITTQESCNPELNQFEWKTISFELIEGKCVKKVKFHNRPIKCDERNEMKVQCDRETGIETVFKRFVVASNCQCIKKSVIHKKQKCLCERRETEKKHCDSDTNQIVITRNFFELNEATRCCDVKKLEHRRDIQCLEGETKKRFPCNEVSNKRRISITSWTKQNCKCKRLVKFIELPCGCTKEKRNVRTYCDTTRGHFVTESITRTWNDENDKCAETKQERRNPVNCDSTVRLTKTDCDGNTFIETRTWQESNPSKCSCETKVKKEQRPCKCPTKCYEKPCPPDEHFRQIITVIFKWNDKLEKCELANRLVKLKRCRCPPPTKNVECENGEIVHTTTREVLNGEVCKKTKNYQKVAVVCSKEVITNTGPCDAKTCQREIKTYHQVLDKSKCTCVWELLNKKNCKCCGCPPKTVRTVCDLDGKRFKTTVRYHTAPKGEVCIDSCKPHVARSFQDVQCTETPPPSHWTECNKETCKQQKVAYKVKIENCKCVIFKVMLDEFRTCCCPPNPPPKRFCENGDFVTEHYAYQLVDNICKKETSRSLVRVPCEVNRELVVGPCDSSTCMQEVYGIKMVKNPQTCTCHAKRFVARTQKCCCNKKAHTETSCDGACIVSRFCFYSFDESNRECASKTQTSRSCIQCPAKRSTTSGCNRDTCLRIVYKYSYNVEDCKCKQSTSREAKKCCCPPDTPWVKQCLPDGTILHTKYSYKMVNNECHKKKLKKSMKVHCQEGKELFQTPLPCDSFSCKRAIKHHFEQLSNCACKPFTTLTYEPCCCPPPETRVVCVNEKQTVRVTDYHELVDKQCVPKRRTRILRTVEDTECKNVEIVEPCQPLKGVRTIRTRIYRIENCACHYVKTDVRQEICACPQSYKRVEPCDRTTCLKTCTTYHYERNEATKQCIKKKTISTTPCCCLGKSSWEKTECNPLTGNVETHHYTKTFNAEGGTCDVQKRTTVIETDCEAQEIRIDGDCDHKTRYATDRIEGYRKDLQNCKCVKYSKPIQRLCSCPNERDSKTFCKEETGELVTQVTRKVFMHNECVSRISSTAEVVECNKPSHSRKVCDGCNGRIITTYYTRDGCKCKENTRSKPILCCCPPPEKMKFCSPKYDNVFEYKTTTYQLSTDNTVCQQSTSTKTEVITCPEKETIAVSECDRSTCLKTFTVTTFGVKNCKCIQTGTRTYTKKCCCPPPVVTKTCLKDSGIIEQVTINNKLENGVCLTDKVVKRTQIVCKPTEVRSGDCNTRTSQIVTTITSHKRVECGCKPVIRTRSQLCSCPPPKIIKEDCIPERKTRFVYEIKYVLSSAGSRSICEKIRTNLYEDVCCCPPPKERKMCDDNNIVTITTKWTLKTDNERFTCVKSKHRSVQTITCPAPIITRSSVCAKNRREIKTVKFVNVNCQCKRRESVKLECCECDRLNSKFEKCVKNKRFIVERTYFCKKGFDKCLDQKKYVAIPIQCPKEVREKDCGPCNIKKNFAFYRKVALISYRVDECKCKKIVEYKEKFCHCYRDKWTQFCQDDTIRILKRLIFTSAEDQCYPREDLVEKEITCNQKPITVTESPCDKHGKKDYRIDTSEVKDCQCKRDTQVVSDVCIAPASKQRTYCDEETGHTVTEVTNYRLEKSDEVLFKREATMIFKSKIESYITTSRVATKCPETRVQITCDKMTGDQTRTIIKYKRVACGCKKSQKIITSKCRCPAPVTSVGPCVDQYRKITTTFQDLIAGECVMRRTYFRQRCECPKPQSRSYCEGFGVTVHCTRTYTLTESFSCFMRQSCKRSVITCPSKQTVRSGCDGSTHKRSITTISHELTAQSCECHPEKTVRTEYCECAHLDTSETVCEKGVFITTKKIHRVVQGNCPFETQIIRKAVACKKGSKHVGPCDQETGYLTIKREWFENVDCKCVPRTSTKKIACACPSYHQKRETQTCENQKSKVIRIVYHVFEAGRCLTRSSETVSDVVCNKCKTTVGPCKVNSAGIGYKIIYDHKLKAKNCECVWVLTGSRREICQCPPPASRTHCVQNDRMETVTTSYEISKSENTCIQRIERSSKAIECDTRESTTASSCSRSEDCYKMFTVSYKEIRDCKCYPKQRTYKKKCCCPPPTPPHEYCDKDGETIVKEWNEFKLEDGVCISSTKRSTRKVRCDRRTPSVEESRCDGTVRTITTTTQMTKGCKCVPQIQTRSKRCGCESKIWVIKGPCEGYFRYDKTMGIKFNVDTQKCEEYVISCTKCRCSCPPGSENTKCVGNTDVVTTEISYTLNEETNSCEKKISKKVKHLTECSSTARLVRKIKGQCDMKTGYQTDHYEYCYAKDCTCQKKVRTKTWPCNCEVIQASKRTSECENHNRVVTTHTYYINEGKLCLKKVRKDAREIQCIGEKTVRGPCDPQSGHLDITTLKEVAQNCRCVWKVVHVTHVPCLCPPPQEQTKCEDNKWVTTTKTYELIDDQCKCKRTSTVRAVECAPGSKTTRSGCDAFTGEITVRTVHTRLVDCQCTSKVEKRACTCKCPPDQKSRVCDAVTGAFVTRTLTYSLENCQCIAKRLSKRMQVTCPPQQITRSGCVRDESGDGYETTTITDYQLNGCECKKCLSHSKRLCSCKQVEIPFKKCVDNNKIVTYVQRRAMVNEECKTSIYDKKTIVVECGEPTRTVVCDKSTGIETTTITTPNVENCKCKMVTRSTQRRCKCDSSKKLVRNIPCNENCQQHDVYEYEELVDHHCVKRYTKTCITCCCPKTKRVSSQCLEDVGVIETVVRTIELQNGKCVAAKSVSQKTIKCEQTRKTTRIKQPDGILQIRTESQIRVGCQCQTKVQKRHAKWKCPEPISSTNCVDNAYEKLTHSWVLSSDGTCTKQSHVKRTPVTCPADKKERGPCYRGKNGFFYDVTYTSYQVCDCACKPSVTKTTHVCRCDESSESTVCQDNQYITTKITFTPDEDQQSCIRNEQTSRRAVTCQLQERRSDRTECSERTGQYETIFTRQVIDNCKCKTLTRSEFCRCKCPEPTVQKQCVEGATIRTTTITHVLDNCKCITQKSVKLRTINCKEPQKFSSTCDPVTGMKTITKVKFAPVDCKCQSSQSVKILRCCCPPPTTKTECDKNAGMFVTTNTEYELRDNQCIAQSKQTTRKITCERNEQVTRSGDSKDGKIKYVRRFNVREGCQCQRREQVFYKPCECIKPSDIVIAVDESSTGRLHEKFVHHLNGFLKSLVSSFKIGLEYTQFSLIKYAEEPAIVVPFSDHDKYHHIHKIVQSIPFAGHHSDIGKAFYMIRTDLLPKARPDSAKFVIVISDGHNFKDQMALPESAKLKNEGVQIIAVTVQSKPEGVEFYKTLVSTPVETNLYSLETFEAFEPLVPTLSRYLCIPGCPPKQVRVGKCSRSTGCERRTYITTNIFSRSIGKCVAQTRMESETCCCLKKPYSFKKCENNRLIFTSITYDFNPETKACVKQVTAKDVTNEIQCNSASTRSSSKCLDDDMRRITTTTNYMENCRCEQKKSVKTEKCRCPAPTKATECINNSMLTTTSISYELHEGQCWKNQQVYSKEVVCPAPASKRESCNRITCQRRISNQHNTVENCRCVVKRSFQFEPCCCQVVPSTHYKKCNENNEKVYITTSHYFDEFTKTCKQQSIKKLVPTVCNSNPTKQSGECGIRRSKTLYRIDQLTHHVAVACECKPVTKSKEVPCGCVEGREYKRCESGIIVTYKVDYVLQDSECRAVTRRVSQRVIDCGEKVNKQTRGPCQLPGDKEGEMLREVLTECSQRVGCSCRRSTRSHRELCSCPPPKETSQCSTDGRMMIYRRFEYELIKDSVSNAPSCVLRQSKREEEVKCPPPVILRSSPCEYGRKSVCTKVFIPKDCKCRAEKFTKLVPCDSSCFDLLPSAVCMMYARRSDSLCDAEGPVRDQLCSNTCGHCNVCSGKNVEYVEKLDQCIGLSSRQSKNLILKKIQNANVEKCKEKCSLMDKCQSIDYYETEDGKHFCVLNSVNLKMMYNRVLGHMSDEESEKKTYSGKCILLEKHCPLTCPQKKIEHQGKCECSDESYSGGKHCYRKTEITHYLAHREKGRCVKQVWTGLTPCETRTCEDELDEEACLNLKNKGKCTTQEALDKCKHTCRVCECKGTHRSATPCGNDGFRKVTTIHYERNSEHGRCTADIKHRREACPYCPEGITRKIGKCIKGVRAIDSYETKLNPSGKCEVHKSTKSYNCAECEAEQDFVSIGQCISTNPGEPPSRLVVTKYFIRKDDCCKLKKDVQTYHCKDCPKTIIKTSGCHLGHRLRQIVYFVSFGSDSKCYKKVYTRMEDC